MEISIIFVTVDKSIRRVVQLEMCQYWRKISQSNMAAKNFRTQKSRVRLLILAWKTHLNQQFCKEIQLQAN